MCGNVFQVQDSSKLCDLETQIRSAQKTLVGNSGVERSLRKLKPIRRDNIKMDVDWNHLTPDRDQGCTLVNMEINLSDFTECWEFHEWLSNYWRFKRTQ
jgi:hypothetical protein